MNLYFLKISE